MHKGFLNTVKKTLHVLFDATYDLFNMNRIYSIDKIDLSET